MADDLGFGDLGCYGQKQIRTPNLDRMAAEGIRFTSHYAGHTVCRPSRLTLWTGKHSGHTALSNNNNYVLPPGEVTVARLLKNRGYATGGIGKWALGDTSNSGHPNRQGFDLWMGYLNQSDAHNYYPAFLWKNMEKVTLPGNVLSDDPRDHGRVAVKRVTYSHDVMTAAAFDFIRENAKVPFLLHMHWTIPHANNEGGRATGNGMEIPDQGIYKEKAWPGPEKGFAAMITYMDRDVGRLFSLLRELNIDNQTIVFFTSDNGPHSEGGHDYTFFDSNGPLRGYKRDLYEGGIRVPLIVRWPGKIKANRSTDHPSAFWDYLPTACELAGIKPPQDTDGISYLPVLLGAGQTTHDYLYWQFPRTQDQKTALRAGKWKIVQTDSGSPYELYDLSTDIGEDHDLAVENPALLNSLKEKIKQARGGKE